MKLYAFAALFTLTHAHDLRRIKVGHVHQRQGAPPGPVSGANNIPAPSSPLAAVAQSSSPSTSPPPVAALFSTQTSGSTLVTAATSTSAASVSAPSGTPASVPTLADSGVPPLSEITMGMPSPTTSLVPSSYTAGATPPVSGAPVLPTAFVFNAAEWPAQDKVPDTTTNEVKEWMKELDGFNIPDLNPTIDGECAKDTAAASDAANRGWWTCGGYTRPTDIVSCPDKFTWGVSFDDGPSPYTQTLLNYLTEKQIHATFFVVGSRVIERPNVLLEQYMTGHEISVHTWSHQHLTSLTNEQIVAELGWTRKAIKKVLGVTPTSMRPPYGDIDDRVRAICLAMGLAPIIWTRTPTVGQFDTNDWQVAGGLVTGTQSFQSFQSILGNASLIDTGFIVLQHDLFPQTVDLATGYTLQAAMTHNPPLTLQPIGQCSKIPTADLYRESNTNKTFPYPNVTSGDPNINVASSSSNSTSSASIDMTPTLGVIAIGITAIGFSLC